MAATLQARGVPHKNVIRLVDSEAQHYQPTRTNILRVLAETAKTSRRNDLIIVYFSGHGAQVPQPKPVPKGRWIEPDGLDEVFLTRDTKLWDKRNQRVEGALLDDEIGNALAEFTRKGVDIWSIFDTCHAGDMARSRPPTMGSAIWRGVDAGDLGVPIEAIQLSAKVTVGKYRVLGPKQRPTVNVKSMPTNRARLIAFYAAQSNESAPEEIFQFPETGIFPKSLGTHGRFGVFTWELARAMSATPPTFAALAESITQQYQTRPFPTPAFEGTLAKQIFH